MHSLIRRRERGRLNRANRGAKFKITITVASKLVALATVCRCLRAIPTLVSGIANWLSTLGRFSSYGLQFQPRSPVYPRSVLFSNSFRRSNRGPAAYLNAALLLFDFLLRPGNERNSIPAAQFHRSVEFLVTIPVIRGGN